VILGTDGALRPWLGRGGIGLVESVERSSHSTSTLEFAKAVERCGGLSGDDATLVMVRT
jgi:hypothetical protein